MTAQFKTWNVRPIDDAALIAAGLPAFELDPGSHGTQQLFTGGPGHDAFNGTPGADTFNLVKGGADTARGQGAKDTFLMGGKLDRHDHIDGGDAFDTMKLNGNYSAGLTLGAHTVVSVESMQFVAGHTYNLTTNDATVASKATLHVQAGALGAADSLFFDGSHETDGSFAFVGGAGHDVIFGGGKDDDFDLTHGGVDIVHGGNGNDTFHFGATFTAADRVFGDGDHNGPPYGNVIYLDGDYTGAHSVTLVDATIHNLYSIQLSAGHSYDLTLQDANVAANGQMFVDGFALGAGDSLRIDASRETDAHITLDGGAGNDVLIDGDWGDFIQFGHGGNDRCFGNGGDDQFIAQSGLNAADHLDGGTGNDYLDLASSVYTDFRFGAHTIQNIEAIQLGAGNDYKLNIADGNVAAGERLFVDGRDLGASDTLNFSAQRDSDGDMDMEGGAGNDFFKGGGGTTFMAGGGGTDIMIAGTGKTLFAGQAGQDIMIAGPGHDTFEYDLVEDSRSVNFDTISRIDFKKDHLLTTTTTVTHIDNAVTGGQLDYSSFDADLHTALAGHLKADHAILFTADSGDLHDVQFVVIDANSQNGYQSGDDLVICLKHVNGTFDLDVFG